MQETEGFVIRTGYMLCGAQWEMKMQGSPLLNQYGALLCKDAHSACPL